MGWQLATRAGPEEQQLVRGGEGAVVAEALNDVMGRMLTVVSKKTQVREGHRPRVWQSASPG